MIQHYGPIHTKILTKKLKTQSFETDLENGTEGSHTINEINRIMKLDFNSNMGRINGQIITILLQNGIE